MKRGIPLFHNQLQLNLARGFDCAKRRSFDSKSLLLRFRALESDREACAKAMFERFGPGKIPCREGPGANKFADAVQLTYFCLGGEMRASFSAVCVSAVVVLMSAWAQTRTPAKLHPDSLARMEAITSYCEQADPTSGPEYQSRLMDLMRGHSSGEIQADRSTSAYRAAMAQANETLSSASLSTGVKGCTEFLTENY
jgi:hypothetical protein